MFKIVLVPISNVTSDLRPFVQIAGQEIVNKIDAEQRQPLGKWVEMVDELLDLGVGWGHVFQSFYFEAPVTLLSDLMFFSKEIQISITRNQFMVKGILTASFETIASIIHRYKLETDDTLRKFSELMYSAMRHHDYFRG